MHASQLYVFSPPSPVPIFTLHSSPRVLSRFHHLVSNFHFIRAAYDSKRQVTVHILIQRRYGLIIGWEIVDLNAVLRELTHDLRLENGS